MQIGGEREIIVPPAMGYGARKMSDIPANSTLIFGEWFRYAMQVRWLIKT